MAQIKDFELYDINEKGTVVSYAKNKKGKILKPQKASQSKKKYTQVRLFNDEYRRGKLQYIHRLVWETFKGEIPADREIDHIDGDPHNNHIDNLQLITRRENVRKWLKEEYGQLIRDHRDEIIKDYLELGSYGKVGKKWGVHEQSIRRTIKYVVLGVNKDGTRSEKKYENKQKDMFMTLDLRKKEVREKLGLLIGYQFSEKYEKK